jgi:hypothetical protein
MINRLIVQFCFNCTEAGFSGRNPDSTPAVIDLIAEDLIAFKCIVNGSTGGLRKRKKRA